MNFILKITLATFMLITATSNVQAGDIFLKKNRTTSAPLAPLMKNPAPRLTQPDIREPQQDKTANLAIRYYTNCMARKNQDMSEKAHHDLCDCTAKKISQSLTIEDMQNLVSGTGSSTQLNTLLGSVYIPCMESPIRERVFTQCLNNPQLAGTLKNPEKICGCVATDTASFLKTEGESIATEAAAKGQNIQTALTEMLSGTEFKKHSQKTVMNCVMNYAAHR